MSSRIIVTQSLRPIVGSRFQPTGFPDLGPATYSRPDADGRLTSCLLVESAQSMANHLEGTLWDAANNAPIPLIAELPWIRVIAEDDKRYLTSSRTESHRLASAFIKHSAYEGKPMVDVIKDDLGLRDDTPLAPRHIARAIFALDPLALLHGVFFADNQWPGQPKVSRAITGMVEAETVEEAVSGGVKREAVRHKLDGEKPGGTAEGYGSVPFQRVEFTAAQITGSFVIDLRQLDSYGLPAPARRLLEALALYEIASLCSDGIRLRTACDLISDEPAAVQPAATNLDVASLATEISALIPQCSELIDVPGPRDVVWAGGKSKQKKGS